MRDDYCDGLGDCLPVCPMDAITFEEREAAEYDKSAINAANGAKKNRLPCGCPGTRIKTMNHVINDSSPISLPQTSQLRQWPVQIKLIPPNAPYLNDAHLLVSADCTAYAYSNFHQDFIKNEIALIGCPKLDDGDYNEKFTEILKNNNIKSVTVVRMEVPCCGGIENAVKSALRDCGKLIPWSVVIISTKGEIIER